MAYFASFCLDRATELLYTQIQAVTTNSHSATKTHLFCARVSLYWCCKIIIFLCYVYQNILRCVLFRKNILFNCFKLAAKDT